MRILKVTLLADMNETLMHVSGHKFVPNGVRDFDLVCPSHGVAPGFVPYMLARVAGANAVCPLCGKRIGEKQ